MKYEERYFEKISNGRLNWLGCLNLPQFVCELKDSQLTYFRHQPNSV